MNRLFAAANGFALLALILISAGCNSGGSVLSSTQNFPAGTGFIRKTATVDGQEHKYAVFVPQSHKPGEKHPTIIFLHGVLESGSDGEKNVGKGLGPYVAKNAQTWPFVTIFPQSGGDWQGDDRAKLVIACLDSAIKENGADPDRVMVTGLSNGGQGTWLIGAAYRDRFAALVPMCGHTAYDSVDKLANIPIWCFHNDLDMLVSCGGAREMCERIKSKGGNVKLTTYGGFHSDLNHNCWDQAYGEPELIPWMLKQRRGAVAQAGAAGGQ